MANKDLFTYSDVFDDFKIRKVFYDLTKDKNSQMAYTFLYNIIIEMDGLYSKKEIIESVLQNLYLLKQNKLTSISYKQNNVEVKFNNSKNLKHSESIFEYLILKDNFVLGTIGFYLTSSNGEKILRVSNIQGVLNSSLPKNIYDSLNKELKENWRVFLLKKIINFAKENKFKISLELPKKTTDNRSEYIRQLRQYIQTGKKAGLKFNQISIKRINDPEIKNRFKLFFEKKIEDRKKVLEKKPNIKQFEKIKRKRR